MFFTALRFIMSALANYSNSDSRSFFGEGHASHSAVFIGVTHQPVLAALFILLGSLPAGAQTADSADREAGEAHYRLACAECHEGTLLEAPQRTSLALFPPERIVQSWNQALWQPPAWR